LLLCKRADRNWIVTGTYDKYITWPAYLATKSIWRDIVCVLGMRSRVYIPWGTQGSFISDLFTLPSIVYVS